MKMKKSLVGKSNLIYKAFMIIGIILVLYYLVLKLMFGFIAFSSMFCMLGIVLIIYSFIELKFQINIWGKIPKINKKYSYYIIYNRISFIYKCRRSYNI